MRSSAHHFRLERVPPLRNVVAIAHRADEGLDRFIGRFVGEVATLQPVLVAAQPVIHSFLVQKGVEDEGTRLQPGSESLSYGFGGPLANVALRIV